MLTLAEIESTQQIAYELRLDALDEDSLRELLADPPALRRMAPPHLSAAETRRIAEDALAGAIARRAHAPQADETRPSAAHSWPWAPLLSWLWNPLR